MAVKILLIPTPMSVFRNYGNRSRILPISADIVTREERELEVKFTSYGKGSAPDVVHLTYNFYTDTNMVFEHALKLHHILIITSPCLALG
jgi:hypothetical protein